MQEGALCLGHAEDLWVLSDVGMPFVGAIASVSVCGLRC